MKKAFPWNDDNDESILWAQVSGPIAAASTPQAVHNEDGSRVRVFIQNPTTATEILKVGIGAASTPDIELNAGETFDINTKQTVRIQAVTAGHAYVAYVGTLQDRLP